MIGSGARHCTVYTLVIILKIEILNFKIYSFQNVKICSLKFIEEKFATKIVLIIDLQRFKPNKINSTYFFVNF